MTAQRRVVTKPATSHRVPQRLNPDRGGLSKLLLPARNAEVGSARK